MRLAVTLVLGLGLFAIYAANTLLSTMLPQIARDFSLSPLVLGLVTSVYGWAYAVMQVPVGFLTDREGPRALSVLALGVFFLSTLLFAASTGVSLILGSRFLMGIGASFIYVLGLKTVATQYTPRERSLSVGIFTSLGLFGISLTNAIAPVALGIPGATWRSVYLAFAPLSLLALILSARFLPGRQGSTEKSEREPARISIRTVFSRIGRSSSFWLQNAINFAYFGTFFGLIFWLPTYFDQSGLGLTYGGIAVALLGIGAVVGFIAYPWLVNRVSWPLVQRASIAVYVVTIGYLIAVPATRASIGLDFGVLFAIGALQGGQTVSIRMIDQMFESELVGAAYGIYNSATWLGSAFFPALTGFLLSSGMSFELAFLPMLVSIITALALSAFTREVKSKIR